MTDSDDTRSSDPAMAAVDAADRAETARLRAVSATGGDLHAAYCGWRDADAADPSSKATREAQKTLWTAHEQQATDPAAADAAVSDRLRSIDAAALAGDPEALRCAVSAAFTPPTEPYPADGDGDGPWLEMLPKDPKPRRWLVDGLLPAGRLSAIYGDGQAGKSRLCLQLAAAVLDGPGARMLPTDPDLTGDAGLKVTGDVPAIGEAAGDRPVLFVTWEDEPAEFARRWRAAHNAGALSAAHPGDRLRVLSLRGRGPLWGPRGDRHIQTPGDWTDAGKRLIATLGSFRPALAIVDPIAAAYGCSELDRALVRDFLGRLDLTAEQEDCAVLLVGHPPKSANAADRDPKAMFAGNSDWYAAPRAGLILRPEPSGYETNDGKAVNARRLTRAKGSYGAGTNHLWLRNEWAHPQDDAPARLAWWATNAQHAANAEAGKTVRLAGKGGVVTEPGDGIKRLPGEFGDAY